MSRNYLVLVGGISPDGDGVTTGTGVILERNGSVFVITCRHTIREANSKSLFAIPMPKCTKSPKGGYRTIPLMHCLYHPDDTEASNYDLAVFPLNMEETNGLKLMGIEPIDCSAIVSILHNVGAEVNCIGYPVDHTETCLAENNETPLPPINAKGKVLSIPIDDLPQNGFVGLLREAYFAVGGFLGKGASGGLVYEGSKTFLPIGIVLGSTSISITSELGISQRISCVVFADMFRVTEIIDNY